MACGGCRSKRKALKNKYDVMGGYKYLSDRQIKARLEAYKKRYCSDCELRYKCNYELYVNCKKKDNN